MFAMLLLACSRGERDYSSWKNLPAEGWAYSDTIRLLAIDTALSDNDSIVSGSVKFALRHGNDYPYSNIWVELAYYNEEGARKADTVNMQLADVYGRWLGSGISSGYQVETMASSEATIDLKRPLEVRHILRIDTLHGVEQIGILVEH